MEAEAMIAQPSCYVSGTLAKVLRVSRFAGLAPLHFVKKGAGWRVSISRSFSKCGYIMVIVINLITIVTLIGEQQIYIKNADHSLVTRWYVWVFQACLITLVTGTSICMAPGQMERMIVNLNKVHKINSDLNIQHWPISLKGKSSQSIFWGSALAVVTCIVLEQVISVCDTEYYFESKLEQQPTLFAVVRVLNFIYCYCYWILNLSEMQFIIITLHVKCSFKAVNDNLRSLLLELEDVKQKKLSLSANFNRLVQDNKKNKRFNNYVGPSTDSDTIMKSTNSPHETVRHLAMMYTSVCDVMRDVDRSHGLIVLMILGILLINLVCNPYYLITENLILDPETNLTKRAISAMMNLFWCFLHILNLVTIIEPCHSTHVEMETTRVLVGYLMRSVNSIYDPLAVELELFFRHIVLNQVFYKPLKVTTMTRALVVTILGSITTYLVIIIQI